jgi:hypothetical protein
MFLFQPCSYSFLLTWYLYNELENEVFVVESVGRMGETIGEANMNPTSNFLDVENVHLPSGNNLLIKYDYVQLVVIKVQTRPYGNHTTIR